MNRLRVQRPTGTRLRQKLGRVLSYGVTHPQRLYTDIICSNTALVADCKIQSINLPDGEEELEHIVSPLLLASTPTLSKWVFSTATLLPVALHSNTPAVKIRTLPASQPLLGLSGVGLSQVLEE